MDVKHTHELVVVTQLEESLLLLFILTSVWVLGIPNADLGMLFNVFTHKKLKKEEKVKPLCHKDYINHSNINFCIIYRRFLFC